MRRAADEAGPFARALERALHTGTGHFQTFVVNTLDRKEGCDLIAHGFAIVHANAAFGLAVDRDAHESAGQTLEVDEFVPETLHRFFNDSRDFSS